MNDNTSLGACLLLSRAHIDALDLLGRIVWGNSSSEIPDLFSIAKVHHFDKLTFDDNEDKSKLTERSER